MSAVGDFGLRVWLISVVVAAGLVGCGSAPKPVTATGVAHSPESKRWEGSGLRVSLSEVSKSVCVAAEGCPSGPAGAITIRPLDPKLRAAIQEALVGVGFKLVGLDSERDLSANVEWHGTDTIALRLQDVHGRLIDETTYQRSLARCRELPELTWDSCWTANFDAMKRELSRPLRESSKLKTFALKQRDVAVEPAAASTSAAPTETAVAAAGSTLPERLDESAINATLKAHQDELERACFQPAHDARSDSAKSSAKVSTVITIAASGLVEAVTTGGDPSGYLHLASCVATQVRGWRFPAAQKSTTTNVPFIFAAE